MHKFEKVPYIFKQENYSPEKFSVLKKILNKTSSVTDYCNK